MPASIPSRLVLDGIVYFSDGNPEPLRTGGVHAANVTVTHTHAGLEEAMKDLGDWRRRVAAPESGWTLVLTADDLLKARDSGRPGLILGWQNTLPFGSHAVLAWTFAAAGLRIAQLTHNEGNFAGDGCAEERNGGLTKFGRELIHEMNAAGIAVDVSHCGDRTAREAAEVSRKPVLLTHSNAKAVHNRVRNKDDDAIRAVAKSGGVIGLSVHGFMNWDGDPRHPPSLEGWVAHIRHVMNLAGIEHVGIGTDFACVQDEAVIQAILDRNRDHYKAANAYAAAFGNTSAGRYPKRVPDCRSFPKLIEHLERSGFTGAQVDAIAGGNFLRAYRDIWH